ncbi:uncharacterized protein BDV17DRAFT_222472 [Aspergillus undulatus]|uniref:uncharacterized protein n=1 Tax=Aspergillus undulatus TaxID=1810928 RepID=UPI003CCE49D7
MKFLCDNSTTQKELAVWARHKRLVFGRFFFWKTGNELQKSLQGLYRSLLFEVPRQCPDLIPRVFPDQWVILKSFGDLKALDFELFRPGKIKDAFQLLTQNNTFAKHRFCFLIDGLTI